MSERKAETIEIQKGVQYAKVASRSAEFHSDNKECSIETTCEFKEGFVLFSAKVTTSKGTFTGHSMDKITGRQKQFEKQETIAVGRALAFAGYLATGDIACAEEMADVITQSQFVGLKQRFAKEYGGQLNGLTQPKQQSFFQSKMREIIGEDVDYNDRHVWCREWYDAAWKSLIGHDPSVPFDGE